MQQQNYGPTVPLSEEIHTLKYRQEGESFAGLARRVADGLADDILHAEAFEDALLEMRFMPAGRVQAAIGADREVTPYNCFVSGTIPDSGSGIMERAAQAYQTMRLGGGIGYDFSTIRPRGDLIKKLGSEASGPVSHMGIFDAVCGTVSSAGHRRGAQMGVLRVDHPDIEEFIEAKTNTTKLTNFNISIGVTDEFMRAVEEGRMTPLQWGDRVYRYVDARELWDKVMVATWDWAEPGILFIDRINKSNNLWYAELIAATNPCAEQPLPPFGACLLGSFNLTKYVVEGPAGMVFDIDRFVADIPYVIRSMDNIVDRAVYPLPEQEKEAKDKRRMGIGVTGAANAIEALGHPYASKDYIEVQDLILRALMIESYRASAYLAREKGPFPLWDVEGFMASETWKLLPQDVQELIFDHGLRNSHLTSIAPTGTISLSADNISSGIEPVFSYGFDRTIQFGHGQTRIERVDDYGVRVFGVRGKTADQCSLDDHLNVLLSAQKWVDSAVSKTCNIGDHVTFEEFKGVYMTAWKGGAKGCTTFRAAGKRMGILNASTPPEPEEAADDNLTETEDGAACYFDPNTGRKSCE